MTIVAPRLKADLNDIVVFTSVVEAGSFAAAARALGMPRATVSRRVARLEQELGARLLHRTTRSLRLTEIGTSYYGHCHGSLATLREAEALVSVAQAKPRGKLRVSAPDDIGGYLAPMIAGFVRDYPEVHVEVVLSPRMVDLIAEGFDVAVRATGQLPDSSLGARRIAGGQIRLYASADYLDRRGRPSCPRDLGGHDCMLLHERRATANLRLWSDDGEEREVTVRCRLAVNNPAFARDAAMAGAGIAIVPTFLAHVALAEARIEAVLPEYNCGRANLYLVYPSAKQISATVVAFRERLSRDFADVALSQEGSPPT